MLIKDKSFDPRSLLPPDELQLASRRAAPQVARPSRRGDGIGLAAGIIGALALGAFTLLSLSQHRTAEIAPILEASQPPVAEAERVAVAPPPLPEVAVFETAAAPAAVASDALPMVIDNSAGAPMTNAGALNAETSVQSEGGAAFTLSAGAHSGVPARAEPPSNPRTTIVQGTIIPAVLETALNSEMPGFARAIVSRDVRSFDGAAVLVPRGSRLIGHYRAASTPGQSRAYIVWSRLIRPDGVSIQLASPALDMTGAVGVPGNVDRHFFQNFGSSLLLSVVGALPALANAGSATVVIGTNAATQSVQATQSDSRVAPTIRVPIGTPIQVFTARDLSFE